jgi:DNA-binding MarR family transcriptional regulator
MANRLARLPAAGTEAAARRTVSPDRTGGPDGTGASNRTVSANHSGNLDLDALTSSLGYLLRRLQLAYKQHFLREARSNVVQPRYVGAMYVIGLNPGVTPSQMRAALGLDAVQTALMLNALEERGLIVRRPSATDGRSRAVHLTAAGRRMFGKLQVVAARVEQDFISARLTQQEAAQLISLMTRLLSHR